MESKARYMGRKLFKNFTLVTSCSDNLAQYYQQGGTCIGITNRLTGRIINSDCNPSGLGKWSYIKLARKDQRQVTIVTAYQPCHQSNPDNNIVNAQQTR
eukprot:8089522-Ditylum_brightwellii.AAC.1